MIRQSGPRYTSLQVYAKAHQRCSAPRGYAYSTAPVYAAQFGVDETHNKLEVKGLCGGLHKCSINSTGPGFGFRIEDIDVDCLGRSVHGKLQYRYQCNISVMLTVVCM